MRANCPKNDFTLPIYRAICTCESGCWHVGIDWDVCVCVRECARVWECVRVGVWYAMTCALGNIGESVK